MIESMTRNLLDATYDLFYLYIQLTKLRCRRNPMKQSLGANIYLFPLPTAVVGTYDAADRPNMMTASWIGIVNSKPTMLSVSLRKATYTYNSILHHKEFTVSLPSCKHLAEMDYVGTKTGKNEDKFQTTGLTPIASTVVHAPYVAEFSLVLECRLVKHEDLGLHTIFIAEIIDVKIDEDCLLANGKPDFSALDLITYAPGERKYYAQGDFLGIANASWQNSTLNPKFAQDHEGKAFAFLQEHYKKLDDGALLEDFVHDFFWDDFVFDNNGTLIDSHEKFAHWYSQMQNQLFDRKHILTKIHFEHKDNAVFAQLKVVFTAKSWQLGMPKSTAISLEGDISWHLEYDDTSKTYTGRKCQICII